MDDQALQEAIRRARQLAAKIPPSAPVKRPAPTTDHSGPVKVTLAYEKPANSDQANNKQAYERSPDRRSSSREYQRDDRDSRDSRHHRDARDNNHNRESMRDSNRNLNNNTTSLLGGANHQYQSDPMPPSSKPAEDRIEMIIPHAVIGLVIGKGGENIKRIQNESGATVRVDPNVVDEQGNKLCIITGSKQAVDDAKLAVENVIESAGTKRPRMAAEGSDSYRMKIPASRTGAIIGKGGETIKSIKQQSGCDIELDKGAKECGPDESVFVLRGTQDKIMRARSLIEARLASRGRDGPGRDQNVDHHSSRSGPGPKNVATGANAAPVASYPDLPAAYPAAGQHNSADMSTAWAAYFAQFNLLNQGGQPGAAAPGMAYGAQPGLLSSAGGPVASTAANQQVPYMNQQGQTATQAAHLSQAGVGGATAAGAATAAGGQPDYTEQWIAYYRAQGYEDYAQRVIELKKQQEAEKQQQQHQQQ